MIRENGLSERFRRLLRGLWQDLLAIDQRVDELDREIEQIARQDPVAMRLQQCAVSVRDGNGPASDSWRCQSVFQWREMAASFGLTPKQNSSGGKERLLGISKRGDAYLRSLLVHGARAVIRTAQAKTDRLSTWVMRIAMTRHPEYRRGSIGEQDGTYSLGNDQ
jgi:transposase